MDESTTQPRLEAVGRLQQNESDDAGLSDLGILVRYCLPWSCRTSGEFNPSVLASRDRSELCSPTRLKCPFEAMASALACRDNSWLLLIGTFAVSPDTGHGTSHGERKHGQAYPLVWAIVNGNEWN
jgi:hypothetical protein